MDLQTDIKTLGPGYRIQGKKLTKLGIETIQDLFYHIPSRYDDLRLISPIGSVQAGETVTIQGTVLEMKNEYRTRFMTIQKAIIEDKTGTIECRWFNQPYLTKNIPTGSFASLSGEVGQFGKKKALTVKEYEILESPKSKTVHTGRLVPIYPLTRGLSSRWVRGKTSELLDKTGETLEEFLPESILISHRFPKLYETMNLIHFPDTFEDAVRARNRLSYEELFLVQLSAIARREEWMKKTGAPVFQILTYKKQIDTLIKSLPFTLTAAQLQAIDEIFSDLTQKTPMNRLLEGDVGSGKTVVAAIAMYVSYLNGYTSIFMAPTEILANQHYEVLLKLLTPLGVAVGLQTGSTKIKEKDGDIDIFVGTHALLHRKKDFGKLGLVIIDEQQRFGVEQRSLLREKAHAPHFLTMTATPIPRTVFLTVYGDLSLSILNEMPKGRVKVKTWLVPNEKRESGYEWIKKMIAQKDENGARNQVFIICPFIEESENAATVKAATTEFERLSKKVFKGFKLGLLHGKMKGREKDVILKEFEQGKIDILVATPVVEVGIDIPNATIMVIEAAERFGLSQLHQLRGRVGRRTLESFCLLYTDSEGQKTKERLKSLETIYIGAELAELDLKLRGPGEIYGTEQHGSKLLKIASFSDTDLIVKSKNDAQKVYPNLKSYPILKAKVESQTAKVILPD